jgi:hypothetical protein
MVDVNMNPKASKVIGKEACLRVKGLFGLSKYPRPKKLAKHFMERGVKGNKGLYEVGR